MGVTQDLLGRPPRCEFLGHRSGEDYRKLEELVKEAIPFVRKAQMVSRTYGGDPETPIEEWMRKVREAGIK
jgi:hypothetical protein